MRRLLAVLLGALAGGGMLAESRAAPQAESQASPDAPDQEAQLAAQRRQHYAESQRLIAAAFRALHKPVAGPVLTAQLGHSRAINSLALSADGRLLLTGSDDRTARLWAVDSGRELRRFLGQQSNITAVALSPDGQLVATGGGADHTIRVWDAATGAQRWALEGHSETISALSFLPGGPGGKRLASVSWDDSLRVWDLATGKQIQKFEKSVHGLSAVFAPDGRTVMSLDATDHLTLRAVGTGAVITQLELQESSPVLAFAADAALVAIGGQKCDAKSTSCQATLWLWDAPRNAITLLPPGGDSIIRALALSPNKQRLAVGSGVGVLGKCAGNCGVQLLELPSGRELWRQTKFSQDVKALTFTPDGKSLIAAGNDGLGQILEAATGRVVSTLGGEVAPVTAVALTPDGKWLAVGTGSGPDGNQNASLNPNRSPRSLQVILWDLTTGREARRLEFIGESVANLSFSANSQLLAAGSRGDPDDCPQCQARLWEVRSGREVQRFATDVRRGGFALSPDGRTVAGSASGVDSYAIGLWEAQTGKSLQQIESGEQWAFAFAPGSALLATVGGAGDVTLRDAKTGQEQRALSDTSADMRPCVAFSPDGKLVAAGATSLYSSAVWDFQTGKVLSLLDGHSRDVTDIKLSGGQAARGALVATASLDTTALLWAARSGKLQRVLAGHLGGVTAVAFSADDRFVLTGSLDGTARLWATATGRPLLQLVSFRDGGWAVLAPDGRFDASTPERSGCHLVAGDKVVPEPQSRGLLRKAHVPGLLQGVLRRTR